MARGALTSLLLIHALNWYLKRLSFIVKPFRETASCNTMLDPFSPLSLFPFFFFFFFNFVSFSCSRAPTGPSARARATGRSVSLASGAKRREKAETKAAT